MKDGNIKIIQTSRRRCFFRNEQPLMRFDVMNFEPHNFHNCSLTLEIAGIGIVGRRDIPKLNPSIPLVDGVKVFSENPTFDELPMVTADGKFYGIVNRNDIFMAFNELCARDKIGA